MQSEDNNHNVITEEEAGKTNIKKPSQINHVEDDDYDDDDYEDEDNVLEEIENEDPQITEYFRINHNLLPPYNIIIDTNFVNHSIKRKIDLVRFYSNNRLGKKSSLDKIKN